MAWDLGSLDVDYNRWVKLSKLDSFKLFELNPKNVPSEKELFWGFQNIKKIFAWTNK